MIRTMPVIESAKKKMRQDKHRTAVNKVYRVKYREALKEARIKKTPKSLSEAYRALDKAAKKSVLHKKKVARLKSRLVTFIKAKKKVKSK